MNENNNIGCLYSWPVIILALCIFWPVGIFLIIKRVSIDKKAAIAIGGRGVQGVGIALVIFGALAFIGCASDPEAADATVLAFFFMVGGIVLIVKSKKLKREADEIKSYLSIIVNGGVRGIDAIASSMGKSYDTAKSDIQKLISKGYLKNAYINEGTREIVLPTNNIQAQTGAVTNNVAPKIVACPCCGANNTIVGVMGECEYCGSPLK